MVGLKDSPYHVCQAVMWSKSVALGDRRNLSNPFGWEKVVVNFPVKTAYERQCPWVYKYIRYGMIAVDFFFYVDDGQPIEPTETLCWEESRRWGLP